MALKADRPALKNQVVPRDLSKPEELKAVYHELMRGEAVYFSNFFPSHTLRAIPGAREDDLFLSKAILSIPFGYPFGKEKSDLGQLVYDNIGWLNSFGLLNFYKSKVKDGKEKLKI